MKPTLVVNCAALSRAMIESPHAPNLARLARAGHLADLVPSFPAVTCSVQATLVTGTTPQEHGIVANGFYLRELAEVRFWEQPALLVQAPPVWVEASPRPRVAMLFWQNSLYADAECMMTPKPMHTETALVNDCYARPAGLYAALRERLGEFPLMNYWGPMAGIASSKWIAAATEQVWRDQQPDLCLTYLPHLDYNTQRRGPDPALLAEDIAQVDALVGRLAEVAAERRGRLVVLSEYSLTPVTRAVALNRVLREAGLLALRELAGREYLDCGASRAFAMVDHQVAHVYLPPGPGGSSVTSLDRVRDVLAATPGVSAVLDRTAQRAAGLEHHRSGDLVCVADRDAWFSYYWWFDDARAPDYAGTVDIHRKPGYDPVELFFDPATRSIPLNAALVRGSHGRAGPEEANGVLLVAEPDRRLDGLESVAADDVARLTWGLNLA
jgi:predicted AlkP superfamily pyrophosphatase or phosphodiesterase